MHAQNTARRFDINPGPLRVTPERVPVDYDAGRCDATQADGLRCIHDAHWSVLTRTAERQVCGVHVRALRSHPDTAAIEPLAGTSREQTP